MNIDVSIDWGYTSLVQIRERPTAPACLSLRWYEAQLLGHALLTAAELVKKVQPEKK